ncbi:YbaB/EbfC family nucleoid-associated protein [Flindersiella endophytica]
MNGTANPERSAADAHRLSELLSDAKATVTSDDHTVTVTAAPGNVVASIELAQQARNHGAAELGELILATIREATAQLNRDLMESARELGPAAVDAVAAVLGDPSSSGPASAIAEPPGLDELAEGYEDLDPWADLSAEERDYIQNAGIADEALAAHQHLAQLQQDADRQLAEFTEIQQRMAGQSATATSPDGAIEVTVRAGTGVTGIEIDDKMLRHGPTKVGPMVLATIQQATAQLAMAMAGPAQDYAGSRFNVRELVERYQPADDEDDDTRKW